MSAVSRDVALLAASEADHDLIAEFLSARSEMNAELAFGMLGAVLTSSELLALANLRELVQDLPQTPVHTGAEIAMLGRALGYDYTGYSYRLRFDREPSHVFGMEMVGQGNTLELIVLHTFGSRYPLHGTDDYAVDPDLVGVFLEHPMMLDRLLEAFDVLGLAMSPLFYLSPEDFRMENAGAAASNLSDQF